MKKITKKDFIYLSIILLLTTVFTVISIFAFRKKENASYYDNKCFSYAVQNTNLSKNQIVFIGDSITDLYPLDDYYADLPLACYNRGIGGDTTGGVLRRLQVSAFDLAPKKIVLMIGTNDINGGIPVDKIVKNYTEIVEKIQKQLPTTSLYLISVIPQNDDLEEYSNIKTAKTLPKILEVNENIERLAQERGATYIDLFSELKDESNYLIKEYSNDGIHLNAKGFEKWTALLKPYLQEN